LQVLVVLSEHASLSAEPGSMLTAPSVYHSWAQWAKINRFSGESLKVICLSLSGGQALLDLPPARRIDKFETESIARSMYGASGLLAPYRAHDGLGTYSSPMMYQF